MKPGYIVLIVVCVLLLCCFTHRRVIRALIKHEPMPKAPQVAFLGEKRRQKKLKSSEIRSCCES